MPTLDIILIILASLAALLLILTAAAYIIFRKSFGRLETPSGFYDKNGNLYPPFGPYIDEMNAGKEWLIGADKKEMHITSRDGLRLCGMYVPAAEKTDKLIVLCHGYHSSPYNDFSAAVKMYHDSGFDIFTFFQRSHGESEGKYLTFGIKESYDLLDWVNYINGYTAGEKKIVLSGISMGASTVMYASALDLPKNVVGLVCDCGFTSPYEECKHVAKLYMHLTEYPLMPFVNFFCRTIAKFDLKGMSSLNAMKKCRLPVLFVHGGKDDFVPTQMSRDNFEACASEDKKLIIVDEAVHGISYLVGRKQCNEALNEFFGKLFENKERKTNA